MHLEGIFLAEPPLKWGYRLKKASEKAGQEFYQFPCLILGFDSLLTISNQFGTGSRLSIGSRSLFRSFKSCLVHYNADGVSNWPSIMT